MANTETTYQEDRDADFRVSYDDSPDEVVDNIRRALRKHGLSIADDGRLHEGFLLHQIVAVGGGDPPTATGSQTTAGSPSAPDRAGLSSVPARDWTILDISVQQVPRPGTGP